MFGEEDNRSKVLFLSHHIKGTCINMTYPVGVDLDHHLTEVVFIPFLHGRLLFSHLSVQCSLQGRHLTQPLREE